MEEKKGFFSYSCIEIGVPEEPIVKIGEVVIIKKEEFDKMEYCLNLFTEAKDWYWNIASLYDTKNKFEVISVLAVGVASFRPPRWTETNMF